MILGKGTRKNADSPGVAPIAAIRKGGPKRSGEKLTEAKEQTEFYIDLLCHDINNMNQVALGYLEMAIEKDKQGKYDPALLAKPMDMLKDSSKLIESVRKIRRITAGGQKLEALDLGNILESVIAQYSSVPGTEVTIYYVPGGKCPVVASEFLKDIFSNLIVNSIKHSSGPVTINIGLARVADRGNDFYRVNIADDGPGIPDEMKATVFDRLARGTTRAKGKGLGLYLVKSLVESFNGRVWVEDRVPGYPGKGCKFVVMLPAAKNTHLP